jgi:hypothetical protein
VPAFIGSDMPSKTTVGVIEWRTSISIMSMQKFRYFVVGLLRHSSRAHE